MNPMPPHPSVDSLAPACSASRPPALPDSFCCFPSSKSLPRGGEGIRSRCLGMRQIVQGFKARNSHPYLAFLLKKPSGTHTLGGVAFTGRHLRAARQDTTGDHAVAGESAAGSLQGAQYSRRLRRFDFPGGLGPDGGKCTGGGVAGGICAGSRGQLEPGTDGGHPNRPGRSTLPASILQCDGTGGERSHRNFARG